MAGVLAPPGLSAAPTHLFDLLDMLPLVEVHDMIWSSLSDPRTDGCKLSFYSLHRFAEDSGRAPPEPAGSPPAPPFHVDTKHFRLVCRQARLLADQLLAHAACCLARAAPAAALHSSDDPSAWHAVQQHSFSFLARLPRLRSLKLAGWSSSPDLAVAIGHGSRCAPRVTHLSLDGPQLCAASLAAVCAAWPALRGLDINQLDAAAPQSEVDLFRSLHTLRHLTKLTITHPVKPIDNLVHEPYADNCLRGIPSLAGLSALRSLQLDLCNTDRRDLRSLTGLINLRHFALFITRGHRAYGHSMLDIEFIFHCAHLTSLHLLNVAWASEPSDNDDYGLILDDDDDDVAAQDLPLLSHLTNLVSLHLGNYCNPLDLEAFHINAAALARLRDLPHLTDLHAWGFDLTAPTPGHLTQLQRLSIRRHSYGTAPAEVLESLQALLPLPSLVDLDMPTLYVHHRWFSQGVAEARLRDLGVLAQHLAAAPRLRMTGAWRLRSWHTLPPAQIAHALQPLTDRFPHFTFDILDCLGY